MKITTLRTIVGEAIAALDTTTTTRITEIVFEGEAVYVRTNHSACQAPTQDTDEIQKWLNQHDPHEGQGHKADP